MARTFGTLLGVLFLVAWASLGVQLNALYGERGLLPIGAFMEALAAGEEVGFFLVPSVFWWVHSDAALWGVLALGTLSALAATLGFWVRPAFLLSSLLYMSFATAGRTFLSFQWDNLLIEAGVLAALLPRDRPCAWAHTLLRLLMFKLYFESGIAKWQSSLGDWRDGSAMLLYFQTAPLPTALAWYAHHLPEAVLRWLSHATLFLELVIPWGIFGPRLLRLVALVSLTVFQVINMATANYGFFCPLALVLHLFLLDDADLPGWLFPKASAEANAAPAWGWGLILLYVYLSVGQAVAHFADRDTWPGVDALAGFRAVNTYHLFGAITRTRYEPEVQIDTGGGFVAYDLKHKPGDVHRAPDFVAPHQPRLDFQLWFHGLSPRTWPGYVDALMTAVCDAPDTVQTFFAAPLPAHPKAVRMAYWSYSFTDAATRDATGAYWMRVALGARPAFPCGASSGQE